MAKIDFRKEMVGKSHEIHLIDPRRAAPKNLKTVL